MAARQTDLQVNSWQSCESDYNQQSNTVTKWSGSTISTINGAIQSPTGRYGAAHQHQGFESHTLRKRVMGQLGAHNHQQSDVEQLTKSTHSQSGKWDSSLIQLPASQSDEKFTSGPFPNSELHVSNYKSSQQMLKRVQQQAALLPPSGSRCPSP